MHNKKRTHCKSILLRIMSLLLRNTCTVALGIHARDMNTFSRMLKPAHSTQTKVNRILTSRAMSSVAIPRPGQTDRREVLQRIG